jgi:cytochrome c oxidase subunit 1
MSGRQYPEFWGKAHYWCTFIGVDYLGLAGMPRRYSDYSDAFAGWNFVASIGACISGIAFLIFLDVLFRTFTSRRAVAANPWGEGATTLEWTLPSPPPHHTYEELPMVA